MAEQLDTIQIRADQHRTIRCTACLTPLVQRRVASMFRNKPGGPFDPFCVACTIEIVKSARVILDAVAIAVDSLD